MREYRTRPTAEHGDKKSNNNPKTFHDVASGTTYLPMTPAGLMNFIGRGLD